MNKLKATKGDKELGWMFLILAGISSAVFCYNYVPLPFEFGAVTFTMACVLVGIAYELGVDTSNQAERVE